MGKILIYGVALAAIAVAGAVIPSKTHAQPYYGGMMGGYGSYGMMGGGDGGYAMGPGMMGNYGYGPGMMYGHYGPQGERYYHRRYHGQRLCWHQTGVEQSTGYYGSCW